MTLRLRFGFSPCPNDTHAFFGIAHGVVPVNIDGEVFEIEPILADIEELNERALGADPLEISKLSTGVLHEAVDRYQPLEAGAALGRGVGPLVVRRDDEIHEGGLGQLVGERVAIPGFHTTAFSLLRRFGPEIEPVVMRFDRILSAVESGDVRAGLIIHESRFTYRDHGLVAVADLGRLWEAAFGLPLPLAVIGLSRSLPAGLRWPVTQALTESVRIAQDQPRRARSFVRQNAQEMEDAVCAQHIGLYVNEFSLRLGLEGREALKVFLSSV
ncbi:MAG: 1,4-dihydroxy-6-naphthoate synthase [Planctomycetota bacterium]